MDAFWEAPPVTRTLTAATVALSVLCHTGVLSFAPWIFLTSRIFKFPPEIWRLATSFYITGPQLGLLFQPYFLFTQGSMLEKGSPQFSGYGDFFTYVVVVKVMILGLCGLGLGGVVFLDALTMAFTYTRCQENPHGRSTLFFFNIENIWFPWALLFLTLVLNGPMAAYHEATGIPAAHMFYFFTRLWPTFGNGKTWIRTPDRVAQWFGAGSGVPRHRSYGTVYEPSRGQSQAQGAANPWSSRGPGRRLG
jgi:Derlin-2/3